MPLDEERDIGSAIQLRVRSHHGSLPDGASAKEEPVICSLKKYHRLDRLPIGEAVLFSPDRLDRAVQAGANELRPVAEEIDWLSPIDAYDLLRAPNSFLLESVAGGDRVARYSLIGVSPLLILTVKNGHYKIMRSGEESSGTGDPFNILRSVMDDFRIAGDGIFTGAAAGFIGYDSGRYIEKIPTRAIDDLSLPDCRFMIMDTYVHFDHKRRSARIIILDNGESSAKVRISRLRERLRVGSKRALKKQPREAAQKPSFTSNFEREDFEAAVSRAKEYIFAGDIYQVNLSQRLATPLQADPLTIYRRLRDVNPSPFAGYFDFGDWQLVSCSPERLVSLEGDRIETRPIAGTYRRGGNEEEDRVLIDRLKKDIKERAEHIMLVDLERNDIGRVSDYGSVLADELMVTESYSHVTHIVSNVIGRLHASRDRFDLIRAVFPGGTITGCPKVRAMEIIEELEPIRRGPYTGSMGYIGFNGDMDLNIIIRTMVVKDGMAYVQAGAGIVADSVPQREYNETLYKAEALIKATLMAEAGDD